MTDCRRCVLAIVGLIFASCQLSALASLVRPVSGSSPRVVIGKLPLYFEKNQGQVDASVAYLSRAGDHFLYLTHVETIARSGNAVVRMRLLDASLTASFEGVDVLPGKSHYLVGRDARDWHIDVAHYGAVRRSNVYPNVDVIYRGKHHELKCDFVVRPGGKPDQIRIRFDGAESLDVAGDARLSLEVGGRRAWLQKPFVYQDVDGVRRSVRGSYRIFRDERGESVGFKVGSYDSSRPLMIDPVLTFSTFLGGALSEAAKDVALDSSGAIYISGTTSSLDFPRVDAFQPNHGGGSLDAFVAKISADGTTLLYSTYLGGSGSFDEGYGIAVGGDGSVYVTGETNSSNFPVLNPIQAMRAGGSDAFISKLRSDGAALVYSTYLGGTTTDKMFAIAVDASGAAYTAGHTSSLNFPVLNPIQSSYAGGFRDAILAKVDPMGALAYATYLGGTGNDEARGIAVDASGAAYITGDTRSTDFPTKEPLQPSLAGGADVFVSRIHPSGGALEYSTFLGGTGEDESSGLKLIAVDHLGTVFVTGGTASTNFPTVSAAQPTLAGGVDVFVAKISPTGGGLLYSTYLGGSTGPSGTGYDDAYGIAVDSAGNAYVAGRTESSNFPTVEPFQASNSGAADAFVAVLSADGSTVRFSTYAGGTGEDRANAIEIDPAGGIHIAGQTFSTNFPLVNALQPTYAGNGDAFLLGISGILPPGVVEHVGWSGGAKTEASWSAVAGATDYHLYRGEGSDLPKLLDSSFDSCLRLSVTAPISGPVLVEDPSAGTFFWYLVRAENANGLGSAGNATAGPRVHDSSGGCP